MHRDNGKFRDGTYSLTAPSIDLANVDIIIITPVIVFTIIIMFKGNPERNHSSVAPGDFGTWSSHNPPRICVSDRFWDDTRKAKKAEQSQTCSISRWQQETLASTTAQQAAPVASPRLHPFRFRWLWQWRWSSSFSSIIMIIMVIMIMINMVIMVIKVMFPPEIVTMERHWLETGQGRQVEVGFIMMVDFFY